MMEDPLPSLSLETLPVEILDYLLDYLPALDAYFLRFVCRALRWPAVARVDRAVAEMVRNGDGDAFFDFTCDAPRHSIQRAGVEVAESWRTHARWLARAKLDPGSAMALGMIMPTTESTLGSLQIEAKIFRELKPSRLQVKAAVEYVAMINVTLKPDVLAVGLFYFLSNVGMSRDDMIFVAERLRRVPFIVYWILGYLILEDDPRQFPAIFRTFFRALASQEDLPPESATDFVKDLTSRARPVLGRVPARHGGLVFKFCSFQPSVQGALFAEMIHDSDVVDAVDAETATDYVRVLQEIVSRWPKISRTGFEEFYERFCTLVLWIDVVPGFLDPERCPDQCPIRADWFISDNISRALGYLGPVDEEIRTPSELLDAKRAARSMEENEIRQFIRSVLAYPGRISRERLYDLLDKRSNRVPWAPIVFDELEKVDQTKVLEERIADLKEYRNWTRD